MRSVLIQNETSAQVLDWKQFAKFHRVGCSNRAEDGIS